MKRIDWVGGQAFDRTDLETAFFGQDHWIITPRLAMDVGTRFERQGITDSTRVAPRIGLAWTPFANQQTTIRGGFGLFYDRVPLSVFAFNGYPEQVITTFGPNGEITDGPRHFINITDRAETRFPLLFSRNVVGNFAPYSETWNVEVEHSVTRMLRVRANYLQSNSFGLVIFTPKVVQDQDALVLGGGGRSGYDQLELTARLLLSRRSTDVLLVRTQPFAGRPKRVQQLSRQLSVSGCEAKHVHESVGRFAEPLSFLGIPALAVEDEHLADARVAQRIPLRVDRCCAELRRSTESDSLSEFPIAGFEGVKGFQGERQVLAETLGQRVQRNQSFQPASGAFQCRRSGLWCVLRKSQDDASGLIST